MLRLAAVAAGSPPADLPDFPQVVAAAGRLQGRVVRTPVIRSDRLDERCDRKVFLKCENLQHAGAFKYRGATHALLALEDEAVAGRRARVVATHSSGNHGAALARAARLLGWRCLVVTPRDASPVKLAAILAEGAELHRCEPGLAPREAMLATLVQETGAAVVHPFDDSRVIAGQGTAALELLAEQPRLDVFAAPVGGGGLLAGCALAARPFAIFGAAVDDVLTVSESAIIAAMRVLLEEVRLLIEPSSAVPIAALLEGRLGAPGDAVGIVLSGGNVDLSVCPFLAGRSPRND
jgi:threonine dehydratase